MGRLRAEFYLDSGHAGDESGKSTSGSVVLVTGKDTRALTDWSAKHGGLYTRRRIHSCGIWDGACWLAASGVIQGIQ